MSVQKGWGPDWGALPPGERQAFANGREESFREIEELRNRILELEVERDAIESATIERCIQAGAAFVGDDAEKYMAFCDAIRALNPGLSQAAGGAPEAVREAPLQAGFGPLVKAQLGALRRGK